MVMVVVVVHAAPRHRSYSILDILQSSIIVIIQDFLQALNTYKCM